MKFNSNNHQKHIVTIYTYIVKRLYIVTILSLLRQSIYTKLLYGGLVNDNSNEVIYLPPSLLTIRFLTKTSEEFLRLPTKTSKSQSFMNFISRHIVEPHSINRDISPRSN